MSKMKSSMFIVLLFLSVAVAYGQQQYAKGYVYCDRNGNGKHDRGEEYLPGVGVTNGSEIVLTDRKGYYKLPVDGEATIAVIKPAQYRTALGKYNIPASYYYHKPAGTPRRENYAGIAPTGKLPASIDFGLIPQEEPEAFTVLLMGDPQPHFPDHIGYFSKAIVSELENIEGVSFGISLGDVNDENFDLFEPYNREIGKIGIPWYNLMGNHDMDYEARTDMESDDAFETFVGPANYAFNYGNAHFLVLDDVLFPDPRSTGNSRSYWGGFREDQKAFIKNDLSLVDKDKLVVVAFHIPMLGDNAVRQEDKAFLFQCLKDFPHVLLLSAHLHRQNQFFHTSQDGWEGKTPLHEFNAGATCGDFYSGYLDGNGVPLSLMSDGTPKGYAFLRVEDNRYSIDYKVAGRPADYKMSVNIPRKVVRGRHTPAHITVNFFMGSEKDTVVYRIDGGPWKAMKKEDVTDPDHDYMVQCWNRDDAVKYARWPDASYPSSHIWRVRVPSALPVGMHAVEVKVTDMFGKTHYGKGEYEVVEAVRMYP